MNNKFMKYINKRNLIITLITFLVIVIPLSFKELFISNKGNSNENQANFSKYEVYNNNIILLTQVGDKFILKKTNEEVVYETDEHISDFIFLNDNTLLLSLLMEETTNGLLNFSVGTLNIDSKEFTEIYNLGGEVSLYSNNGNPVIVNNELKQVFEFGETNKTTTFDVKFDKIFKSNNGLFGIYHFIENNIIKTKIYQYKENGFERISIFNGEVTYISTDFNNPNKIYITYNSSVTNAKSIICEKYIVNMSTTDSGEVIYDNVSGRVLSGKDTNYIIDSTSFKLSSITKDFTDTQFISNIYTKYPLSFVKIDSVTGDIFFIDNFNKLRKGA